MPRGRPPLPLTPEEKAVHRRKQVAEAQANRRKRLKELTKVAAQEKAEWEARITSLLDRIADLEAQADTLRAELSAKARQTQAQAQLDARLAEVEARERQALESHRRYQALADSVEDQHEEIRMRLEGANKMQARLKAWEREVAARERAVGKLEDSNRQAADATRDIAAVLVERFTTREDWRTGKREEREAWSMEQTAQTLFNLTRRTKAARTAIQVLRREFKDLLPEHEDDTLDRAQRVLGQLSDAATHAKEKTGRLLEARKKLEAEQHRQAREAVEAAFSGLDPAGLICLVAAVNPDYGDAWRELARCEDNHEYHLSEGVRKSLVKFKDEVVHAIRSGQDARAAAGALRARFDEQLPGLLEKHVVLIERILASVVQAKLEQANAAGKKARR